LISFTGAALALTSSALLPISFLEFPFYGAGEPTLMRSKAQAGFGIEAKKNAAA
jgi:hypothetical protein